MTIGKIETLIYFRDCICIYLHDCAIFSRWAAEDIDFKIQKL